PALVVRQHDPARSRRLWLMLVLAWLASLLLIAVVVLSLPRSKVGQQAASSPQTEEVSALKARIAVLERSEQIATTALGEMQQTLREREEEIAGVRADLAFYGRLVGSTKREGLSVHALRLEPVTGSRAWNFTATLTQNFKRGPESRGKLSLSVEGVVDGALQTVAWSKLASPDQAAGISYGFKYFQQVRGIIMLPEGLEPHRVRVTAEGEGGRATQEFSWNEAAKAEEIEDVR
ncbi:MAG: DUF6776 family protein, partial [Dokdonella sp.]